MLAADAVPETPRSLPEAAVRRSPKTASVSGRHAPQQGPGGHRHTVGAALLRSVARLPGRAPACRWAGAARPHPVIELPGTLTAGDARALINSAAERAGWARDTLAWRIAELDPRLAPAQSCGVPGQAGLWRIDGLGMARTGCRTRIAAPAAWTVETTVPPIPGACCLSPDLVATADRAGSLRAAMGRHGLGRLPPSSQRRARKPQAGAALRSMPISRGQLVPLGRQRVATVRSSARSYVRHRPLPRSGSSLAAQSRSNWCRKISRSRSTPTGLANGANRALLGSEVFQFVHAAPLGARALAPGGPAARPRRNRAGCTSGPCGRHAFRPARQQSDCA